MTAITAFVPIVVMAEMSSTNYRIRADAFSVGGDDTSSSASYLLRDSAGGISANATSTSYQVRSGYRASVFDQVVSLDVTTEETSTAIGATALSGNNVTVSSTSGFSVGNMILVVEDTGTTHDVAAGLIQSIAGSVLTVDSFVSNTTVTIDGVDDVVYRAEGASLAFGALTSGGIAHRTIAWQSFVDVPNGFNVYLSEDQDLTSGGNTITDVADGAVTAGSSEFGARSSDTSLSESTFDTADAAITSTPQQVASVASSAARQAKGFVQVKAAVSASTLSGSYATSISLIAAPVF